MNTYILKNLRMLNHKLGVYTLFSSTKPFIDMPGYITLRFCGIPSFNCVQHNCVDQ